MTMPGAVIDNRPMAETRTIPSYTDVELESYLPSGWRLLAGREPTWDEKRGALLVEVVDMCDLGWELVVPADDVEHAGRIPALKQALDRLDRRRFKSWI